MRNIFVILFALVYYNSVAQINFYTKSTPHGYYLLMAKDNNGVLLDSTSSLIMPVIKKDTFFVSAERKKNRGTKGYGLYIHKTFFTLKNKFMVDTTYYVSFADLSETCWADTKLSHSFKVSCKNDILTICFGYGLKKGKVKINLSNADELNGMNKKVGALLEKKYDPQKYCYKYIYSK